MAPVLLLLCLAGVSSAHELSILNNCSKTVWVGLLGAWLDKDSGFELSAGQSHITTFRRNHIWATVWGRTGCLKTSCETGDCPGPILLQCPERGVPPATFAEINFGAGSEHTDFYYVTHADGFNLPMTISPRSGYRPGSGHHYCAKAGCTHDLVSSCPPEMEVYGTDGVVACNSACLAFPYNDAYCCRGDYETVETCPPNEYSKTFKELCPNTYSYVYDNDQTSLFSCNGTDFGTTNYDITFC